MQPPLLDVIIQRVTGEHTKMLVECAAVPTNQVRNLILDLLGGLGHILFDVGHDDVKIIFMHIATLLSCNQRIAYVESKNLVTACTGIIKNCFIIIPITYC